MDIRISRSIEELGSGSLTELDGGLDFSYGLLRAIERSLWGRLEVRYLTVEDGDGPVAFTPVYLGSNLNFNALLPRFVQSSYAAMVAGLGVGFGYSIAVVGSLISDRGWIPTHRRLTDRAAALRLLLVAVDELARSAGCDLCLLKDIHEEYPAEERGLMRRSGFSEGYSLPTIHINTRHGSFEEYLQRHLTKNGRKHARKQFRKAEGRYELRAVEDFAPLVPRVYPLLRATFLRARYQFEELPPRFFSECSGSEHPRTEMILCEQDGAVAGALLVFYDAHQQLNKRIGIDYRRSDSGLIYNLLNYEGIRRAIERGISTLLLGQSSYLPKTRMGGELTDQYLLIKGYRPLLRVSLPVQNLWMRRYRAARVLAEVERGESP